ncbi:hypothetical protein BOO69_00645 [Sulfitobacter alexandrii]|uniref:Type II secretion system protein K n=1 Tax=Sulfitobacter alexandrii TaxID=1917485 RepID=A0A1J0WD20_9RHOB|nr:type II secretion system minor pseudopilin GspK [Sulfitobacter alexandrii]APE42080.1 hypothetical protein BOO69_00645 [Sulfitobacter alexandrii]
MNRQSGFVLVNALVIVAALAGAAVILLTRAEGGRARLQASQTAGQLTYYLDAFDALAITLLNEDLMSGSHDHPGEAWARTDISVPLDRGRVAGRIIDQQALFNLNWLNDQTFGAAQPAFDKVLQRAGISPRVGDQIRDFIQPGGPANKRAYAALSPGRAPIGGALLIFDQIADIPGLTAGQIDQLRSVVTAIPGSQPININTAPLDLIVDLIPDIPPGTLYQVLGTRRSTPFTSLDGFTDALEARLGGDLPETFAPERLSVSTDWFRAEIAAELDGHLARRTTQMYRLGRQTGTLVNLRISQFD